MENKDQTWVSFANYIAQEVLFMLPAGAGKILLRELSTRKETERQADWYGQIFSWNAEELITQASREGALEDKCVFVNVFLWKQKHGLIDRNLRIHADMGPEARPLTYYIHRYMVENGYTGIVAGDDPYTGVGVKYGRETEALLDRWALSGFRQGDNGFWDTVLLLNVLGRTLSEYKRRSEVLNLANYILENHSRDPRLKSFQDDRDLAALTLLTLDLGMEKSRTWPPFRDLLMAKRYRSVLAYPALIAAAEMYGTEFRKTLMEVELPGRPDLLFSLLDA